MHSTLPDIPLLHLYFTHLWLCAQHCHLILTLACLQMHTTRSSPSPTSPTPGTTRLATRSTRAHLKAAWARSTARPRRASPTSRRSRSGQRESRGIFSWKSSLSQGTTAETSHETSHVFHDNDCVQVSQRYALCVRDSRTVVSAEQKKRLLFNSYFLAQICLYRSSSKLNCTFTA